MWLNITQACYRSAIDPFPTNLAETLRRSTIKSHSMAENLSCVKSVLGGFVDKNHIELY